MREVIPLGAVSALGIASKAAARTVKETMARLLCLLGLLELSSLKKDERHI
jgi:hypothetical protein